MAKGCPKCGRILDKDYDICPYCKYDFKEIEGFFNRVNKEKYLEDEKYAGFIKRLVAANIDSIIISIITSLITMYMPKTGKPTLIWFVIFISLYVIVSAIMERTSLRGTIGKKIIGIEVVDEYENPETFGKALIRNIAKIVNVITLGIGFLFSAVPPTKQSLSDRLSKTYVINKIELKEEKDLGYAESYKRLIAFIIDGLVIYGLVFLLENGLKYLDPYISETYKTTVSNTKLLLEILIPIFYYPVTEAKDGQSIGKKWLNIKILKENEENIGFFTALAREILMTIDIITFAFLLPLSNKKRQTLKDKITKTIVIND